MCDVTNTLWFLVVATVAAAVTADVFSFNEEVDGFFGQFRDDVKHANNSQFPLPNVHAEYSKDILFLSLHGEMNGTEGTVSDVTTIRRTSNVTVFTAKNHFIFRAEFGFDDLKIAYNYEAKFMGIPFHGDFTILIGNNSLFIELVVNITENRCSGNVLTIRSVRFTALEDISVKISGFSLANPLMGYWLGRSFNNVSPTVKAPIEESLLAFFRENIKDFDFCKFGKVPENLPFNDMDSSEDMSETVADQYNSTTQEMNAILN